VTNRERWTLIAAVLGSSIVFVDSSVVGVALPRIGQELPTTILGVFEGLSYVYNGYLLTLSALLILAGALSDFYGRRRLFLIGLVGFGLTSVLCGLAPNMEFLVASRILQGAAGAVLVPGSLALLTATFTGEAQGRAFGTWAAASAATTILGPFVGGIFVDTLSWRAAFLINVPLVVVAVWATLRFVPESRNESASGRFDWLGAAVVALAVGGLSFGAIYGGQREWRDPLAFVFLGTGAVATIAFPFLMARNSDPLVPLELFGSRNFNYLGLFVQGVLGYSASAAGLAGIPGGVLLVFLSTRFGALAARRGPRFFMTVGPALMALGILWFVRTPATSPAWIFRPGDPSTWMPPTEYFIDFLPGQVVFGLGLAMMVAPLTTALMTSVPVRNSGVASAINNAISRVGPQLAGAVIFVAITASFYSGMAARLPGVDPSDPQLRHDYPPLIVPRTSDPKAIASRDQSTEAFHLAALLGAALCATGALVNFLGINDEVALKDEKREAAAAS